MKKEQLIESFLEHLGHDSFLEDDEISLLIKNYPASFYEGEAYRVLIFKSEREYVNADITLNEDKSFTKTLDGIRYFLDVKIPNDSFSDPSKTYIILAKAAVLGLDVTGLCHLLKKEAHSIPAFAFKEQEIVSLSVNNVLILFSGKLSDFHPSWV